MSVAVKIVTPGQVAFEGEAAEIQAPGVEGEFGVLQSHAQMLTLTRPGVVNLHGTQTTPMFVGAGFAEVTASSVTLLVDSCMSVADIDKQAAATALANAESVLSTGDQSSAEYVQAAKDAAFARAQLDA